MRHQDDTASQRMQENSYPWSGRIEKVGRDLLMPWQDADHTEAGAVWVPMEKAAELASALLAQLPGGSDFIETLMWNSLTGRIPDEYLDEAVEQTAKAALLAVEHVIALSGLARDARAAMATPVRKRKWGTDNVIPAGEHEGML